MNQKLTKTQALKFLYISCILQMLFAIIFTQYRTPNLLVSEA